MAELLERAQELAAVEPAVRAAAAGDGRLVVVEGEAGLGKTQLLVAVGADAHLHGMRVLTARASALDRSFAFGVVHQLLDDAVAALDAAALPPPAALAVERLWSGSTWEEPDLDAALHGLYRLVVALAQEQPLALLVDDVHWGDEPSLRLLEFAARRLHGVPLLLALSLRAPGDGVLAALARDPHAVVVQPRPLSADGVAALLERALGRAPDAAFAAACRDATGGNPLLLEELGRGLVRAGVEPRSEERARIDEVGAAAVAPGVLRRLAAVSAEAGALADVLAVLGDGAAVAVAAHVAGEPEDAVREPVRELRAAGILRDGEPLTFVHGLVREAIEAQLPAPRRSALNRAAAGVLASFGAPAERSAAHLLATDPAGDPWVADWLRAAAGTTRGAGARHEAVVLQRRALAEPPRPEDRASLLLDLGIDEAHVGAPEAVARLAEAAELVPPEDRLAARTELALALTGAGRFDEALAMLDEAIATGDSERDAAARLEGHLLFLGTVVVRDVRAIERVRAIRDAAAPGDSTGDRMRAACVAMECAIAARPAEETARWAHAALAQGELLRGGARTLLHFHTAVQVLAWCDELDAARSLLEEAVALARAKASPHALALATYGLAQVRLLAGDLRGAEADARTALGHVGEGLPVTVGLAEAVLIESLVEQGRADETTEAVERWRWLDEVEAPGLTAMPYLYARGLVQRASGRAEAALASFEACGQVAGGQVDAAARTPWRLAAAGIHGAGGRDDRARELVEAERALAEAFGTARAVGRVEHAAARMVVAGDASAGAAALRAAAATLASAPAPLDHAAALVDLGEALCAAGDLLPAREPLAEALAAADACGAEPLAGRARAALVATGARPRRRAVRGADALTPSERRVAMLAAEGLSNRSIADTLFVTENTVEKHLSAAYRKLGIATRSQLGGALEATSPAG